MTRHLASFTIILLYSVLLRLYTLLPSGYHLYNTNEGYHTNEILHFNFLTSPHSLTMYVSCTLLHLRLLSLTLFTLAWLVLWLLYCPHSAHRSNIRPISVSFIASGRGVQTPQFQPYPLNRSSIVGPSLACHPVHSIDRRVYFVPPSFSCLLLHLT